jgi:tetratricopeptide (TPR) repeat protein
MVRRTISPEGALADLEAALGLDPQSRKALQNKAHLLSEQLHRPVEAIETLDRMLELNPHDALALAGRAVLRSRLGERNAAHQDARDALKWDRSPQTCYQAACVYAQTSQVVADDAIEAVNLLGEATKQETRWAAEAAKDTDMLPLAECADFRKLVEAAHILHRTKSALLGDDLQEQR